MTIVPLSRPAIPGKVTLIYTYPAAGVKHKRFWRLIQWILNEQIGFFNVHTSFARVAGRIRWRIRQVDACAS
jgi:hypothetical protein